MKQCIDIGGRRNRQLQADNYLMNSYWTMIFISIKNLILKTGVMQHVTELLKRGNRT